MIYNEELISVTVMRCTDIKKRERDIFNQLFVLPYRYLEPTRARDTESYKYAVRDRYDYYCQNINAISREIIANYITRSCSLCTAHFLIFANVHYHDMFVLMPNYNRTYFREASFCLR